MENGKESIFTVSIINGTPGLVVRGDDATKIEERFLEIAPIFKRIRDSWKKANEVSTPVADVTEQWKQKDENKFCTVHGTKMEKAVSKKTQKPYWYHDGEEGKCFGKGYQPKSY